MKGSGGMIQVQITPVIRKLVKRTIFEQPGGQR